MTVLPLLTIIVTPFFLHSLGATIYGQWMLVNSIVGSLGILNFGLGDAAIRYISRYKDSNSKYAVRVANASFSFYAVLALIIFLILLSLLFAQETFEVFPTNQDLGMYIPLLKWAVVLFSLRLLEQVVFAIFKGYERFDLFSIFSVTSKILFIASNVLAVWMVGSLESILVAGCAISALVLVAELLFLSRFIQGFSVVPKFDRPVLREIISFGALTWVQSIIGILSYQLDKFLVAFLAGVEVLAYYTIGFTVATQIFNFFVAATSWIFPRVSKNEDDKLQLQGLFHNIQTTLLLSVAFTTIVFNLSMGPLLEAWLGEKFYALSSPYIYNYVIFILLTSCTIIPSFYLMGTSNLKLLIFNSLVSVASTVIFMFLFFHQFGTIGLVYGRVLSAGFIVPIFAIIFYKKILHSSLTKLMTELAIPFIAAGLLMINSFMLSFVGLLVILFLFLFHFKILRSSPSSLQAL